MPRLGWKPEAAVRERLEGAIPLFAGDGA